jgi:hypothetical protein
MEETYQDEDFCALCTPKRQKQGLAPYLLITLPYTTAHKNLDVRVCPDCDGSAAELGIRER